MNISLSAKFLTQNTKLLVNKVYEIHVKLKFLAGKSSHFSAHFTSRKLHHCWVFLTKPTLNNYKPYTKRYKALQVVSSLQTNPTARSKSDRQVNYSVLYSHLHCKIGLIVERKKKINRCAFINTWMSLECLKYLKYLE